MPEQKQVQATTEPQSAYVLSRIAGPETARLLGVPVGSIVETRELDIVRVSEGGDE